MTKQSVISDALDIAPNKLVRHFVLAKSELKVHGLALSHFFTSQHHCCCLEMLQCYVLSKFIAPHRCITFEFSEGMFNIVMNANNLII